MQDYIKLFDEDYCNKLIYKLNNLNIWLDGKLTTTGVFKSLKNSFELDGSLKFTQQLTREIAQKIDTNDEIDEVVHSSMVNGVLINKYLVGGHYHGHYDSPIIGNTNHNYSFTVFLNDDYRGGELVVEGKKIKPKQGHIYIYPSDKFHSVNEIKTGTRYAVVGWLKSKYREDHIRENVTNIIKVREFLLNTYGMNDEMYKRADHTLRNLMRHFTQ